MFGGASLAGFLTVLFVSYALWWGLSNVMDQSWAALIVAVIWGAVTGVLLARARKEKEQLRSVLPRTRQTAREIPDAASRPVNQPGGSRSCPTIRTGSGGRSRTPGTN